MEELYFRSSSGHTLPSDRMVSHSVTFETGKVSDLKTGKGGKVTETTEVDSDLLDQIQKELDGHDRGIIARKEFLRRQMNKKPEMTEAEAESLAYDKGYPSNTPQATEYLNKLKKLVTSNN